MDTLYQPSIKTRAIWNQKATTQSRYHRCRVIGFTDFSIESYDKLEEPTTGASMQFRETI